MAIKAHALADFMVECTIANQEVGGEEDIDKQAPKQGQKDEAKEDLEITLKEYWVLYFYGVSKTIMSGADLVLQEGFLVDYALNLDFPTMNNEVEYKSLIARIGLAKALRVKNIKICGDSRLIVSQVNGDYEAKEKTMKEYLRIVRALITQFDECQIEHISREENMKADALLKYASSEIESYPGIIYYKVFRTPTIK